MLDSESRDIILIIVMLCVNILSFLPSFERRLKFVPARTVFSGVILWALGHLQCKAPP
jgi:hypothetical protein